MYISKNGTVPKEGIRGRSALAWHRRGFVLLFSALIASVLLTIGLGIGAIVLKEVELSAIGKQSQIAFFAADTGAECALYWNSPENGDQFKVNADGAITCANMSFSGRGSGGANIGGGGSDPYSNFTLTFIDGACAEVEVEKREETTVIISRGFNICDGNLKRVERALRVRVSALSGE